MRIENIDFKTEQVKYFDVLASLCSYWIFMLLWGAELCLSGLVTPMSL